MDFDDEADLTSLESFPGGQLRSLRRSLGVSQRHLAELSGVDQSVICRLERGSDAFWSTWRRLFVALGYRAMLSPGPCEEGEGLLQDQARERKDRAEAGRAARWW